MQTQNMMNKGPFSFQEGWTYPDGATVELWKSTKGTGAILKYCDDEQHCFRLMFYAQEAAARASVAAHGLKN